MKVYIVGISDCESNRIECICSTHEIAERELFKARTELIDDWRHQIDSIFKEDRHGSEMYERMIKNLSINDDYENWDNHPHECPYLCEMEVMEA